MNDLRQEFTICIGATAYTPTSGGVRALYLLCHHLNEAGFRAVVSPGGRRAGAPQCTSCRHWHRAWE